VTTSRRQPEVNKPSSNFKRFLSFLCAMCPDKNIPARSMGPGLSMRILACNLVPRSLDDIFFEPACRIISSTGEIDGSHHAH
jgi:hypothetical protein